MSLNDKYIINGSTLSDIGNALRTKQIITPETVEIKPLSLFIDIKPPQGQTTEKETRTIDLSSFSFVPTKLRQRAKIYVSNSQSGSSWQALNTWFEKIQTSTGEQITSFPILRNNAIEVDFPLTITMHKLPYSQGSGQSIGGYYNVRIWVIQLLPQNNKYGGYYLPSDFTNFSSGYTYSADNMIAYYAGQTSKTTVTNTIPVENIASTIIQSPKIGLIGPLVIGTYDNYTTTATVLPAHIQSITDIKELIIRIDLNAAYSHRVAILKPSTAQTTYYQNLGGDLGPGTCYRMYYKDGNPNYNLVDGWTAYENLILTSSTYYDIYFKADTRQLLVCSIGGGTQIHASGFPAILMS